MDGKIADVTGGSDTTIKDLKTSIDAITGNSNVSIASLIEQVNGLSGTVSGLADTKLIRLLLNLISH